MSFGRLLIGTYLLLFYVIPYVGNALFADRIFTIYAVVPATLSAFAVFFATVATYLVIVRLPKVRILSASVADSLQWWLARLGATYLRWRFVFAVLCILLSAPYLAAGFTSYRYSNIALSESDSSLVLVMVVFNLLITADFFYCIFVRPAERVPVLSRRYAENVLLGLTLVITANGTGSMLVALISLAYSIAPTFFYRFVFMPRNYSWFSRVRQALIVVAVVPAVFSVAWIAGETIKLSSSGRSEGLANGWQALGDILVRSPQLVENYGYYLIGSVSSAYYSLTFAATASRAQLNGGEPWALYHPLRSFVFRLDYLTGRIVGVPRPEYGSLSRLNYALLSDERQISLRQGTSPGLMASFVYVLPFPFSAIFCGLYLRWISRVTDRLLGRHKQERLSVPAVLLLLFNMLVFFQAPFDLLPIFDNATLYAVIILGMAFVCRSRTSRAVAAVSREGAAPALAAATGSAPNGALTPALPNRVG